MWLAAYMVTGFLVASVYAVGMLRGRRDRYHRVGMAIPFCVAAIATPIQLFVGDTAARAIAEDQPAKFAAMECVYETGPDQTEYIGGICTDDEVKYGIGLPGVDSFLVGWSTDTVVTGLDQIPDDEEPQAKTLLHLSFDAMVGIGTALMGLALWLGWLLWRKRAIPEGKLVPAGGRRFGRGGGGRHVVRLDRDRGRPPALDRLRVHEGRGRGDGGRGAVVRVRVHLPALCGARGRDSLGAALDVAALARIGRRRAGRDPVRPTRGPS